jgi:hypothetical protein
MNKRLLPALLATLLLPACQTWGPTWSEVTGSRYPSGEVNQYRRPAIIERIDDQGAFVSRIIKVTPGMHQVVVSAPGSGFSGGNSLRTVKLDVQPCMRYYINAQFENNVMQNWTPVIDFVESIAGCTVEAKK